MADYKLPIITGTSLAVGDLLRWDGIDWVNYPDSNYAGVYDINGTPTTVYTKYFTGVLDEDASTIVAHGITGQDNILSVTVSCYNSAATRYESGDNRAAVQANQAWLIIYDGTNIAILTVGSAIQGQKYRIRIDYIIP